MAGTNEKKGEAEGPIVQKPDEGNDPNGEVVVGRGKAGERACDELAKEAEQLAKRAVALKTRTNVSSVSKDELNSILNEMDSVVEGTGNIPEVWGDEFTKCWESDQGSARKILYASSAINNSLSYSGEQFGRLAIQHMPHGLDRLGASLAGLGGLLAGARGRGGRGAAIASARKRIANLRRRFNLPKKKPATPKKKTPEEQVKGRPNNGKKCKTCKSTAQPTLVVQGVQTQVESGFALPGLIPLFIETVYQGDLNRSGPFGHNRIVDFDATIVRTKESLEYVDAGCAPIKFAPPIPIPGHWEEDDHVRPIKLAAGPKRSLVLHDEKELKTFHKFPDSIWRIVEIRDENQNTLVLERRDDGRLEQIVTPEGMKVTFTYNSQDLRTSAELVAPNGESRTIMRWAYDAKANMTLSECPYGDKFEYRYDDHRNRVWLKRNGAYEANYSFDEKNRVTGYDTNYYYDKSRFIYDEERLATTYIPAGDEAALERYYYDEKKWVFAEANALGHIRRSQPDDQGYLATETDAEGNTRSFTYDPEGNIRSVADGEGRETFYYWDQNRNLEIVIDPEGNSWDYEYDEFNNVNAIRDPLEHRTEINNNEQGQPLGICRHDGYILFNSYDPHHRLAETVDFGGGKTVFERDAFGRIAAITDPAGQKTIYSYEEIAGQDFWEPVAVTRPDDVTTRSGAGGDRATTMSIDGEGRRTTISSDAFGNILSIRNAVGETLQFKYDRVERLAMVVNQTGLEWTFNRDGAGRIVSERDFGGNVTDFEYDAADRLIRSSHMDGTVRSYEWDGSDLMTKHSTLRPGIETPDETIYWYDDRGLLAGAKNSCATIGFERDAVGQIIAEISNGFRIENDYNCCGDRTERRMFNSDLPKPPPDPGAIEENLRAIAALNADTSSPDVGDKLSRTMFDYFPMGGLKEMRIGDHAPLEFDRDARGLETIRETETGFSLVQSHDEIGQLTLQESGRGAGQPPQPVAFGEAVKRPSAGSAVQRSYAWNKTFEPLGINDARWGALGYTYDKNGQITETAFGDEAREHFQYDAALNIQAAGGSGSDGRGLPNEGPVRTVYTSKLRPSSSEVDAEKFQNWTTSKGGRVEMAHGPRGERIQLTYDTRSRVIERRVDRNGFRLKVWKYEWNDDQLSACVTPEGARWVYGYDPFGRRMFKQRTDNPDNDAYQSEGQLKRATRTGRVDYVWDGDVIALEIVRNPDGGEIRRSEWIYEPETFVPLAKRETDFSRPVSVATDTEGPVVPVPRLFYTVTDHLGTPREMLSEDGTLVWAAEYTTWGQIRRLWQADNDDVPVSPSSNGPPGDVGLSTEQWLGPRGGIHGNLALAPIDGPEAHTCPIRFQGQWADEETGLHYNRFRYYDPQAAQYLSPDPTGILGGLRSQGYVESPSLWVDRLGLKGVTVSPAPAGAPYDFVMKLQRSVYPETAGHIQDAIKSGQPDIMTPDRIKKNVDQRRRQSLKGTKCCKGKDRDEYPMAMSKEGGEGASVRKINPSDNRGAGKSIGSALSKAGVMDGQRVKVMIVP